MSSVVLTPTQQKAVQSARPSFFGLMGGEFFKLTRMWSTRITFVLLLLFVIGPSVLLLVTGSFAQNLKQETSQEVLRTFYTLLSVNLGVIRVFIGFFLIILVANVIGREYSLGTIRILLARGVGRLQLLFAKLSAIIVTALVTLLVCLLAASVMTVLLVLVKAGNLDSFKFLNGDFWSNTWLYLLSILVSMALTILLATAMTAIGRSLTFGLSAGLAWFPADNLATLFMLLAYRVTKNDFWQNISAYLLGPNLNIMPKVITAPSAGISELGSPPLVSVDSTHTLLVALGYAVVFAAIAIYLTWQRDVKE